MQQAPQDQRVGGAAALRAVGVTLLLTASAGGTSQVITDGSLGPAARLASPEIEIGEALGQRVGQNLFHSFREFSVTTGQSVTFTADTQQVTRNIISRVTGLQPSRIDGLLRSEVPGADFWLLNPNGIVISPEAHLDIPGGIHLGTAASLRMPNGSFAADAAAPVTALAGDPVQFGFLDAGAGRITVNGAQLQPGVTGAGVSLSARDITLNNTQVGAENAAIRLHAPQGDVQIGEASSVNLMHSAGQPQALEISAGRVIVQQGSTLETRTSQGRGPDINLSGNTIRLRAGAVVQTSSTPGAQSGNIFIGHGVGEGRDRASHIRVTDSLLSTDSGSFGFLPHGSTGDLLLRADRVHLRDAGLSVRTVDGAPGSLSIETLSLQMKDSYATVGTAGRGDAGTLSVHGPGHTRTFGVPAEEVILEGSAINASSFDAALGGGEGRAGLIEINALELTAQGREVFSEISALTVDAPGSTIRLNVDQLVLRHGSPITVATSGTGNAGNIILRGALTGTGAPGPATLLEIKPDSYLSSTSEGGGRRAGAAGVVDIAADHVSLFQRSAIRSETRGGRGGDIRLAIGRLDMRNAEISTSSTGAGLAGRLDIGGTRQDTVLWLSESEISSTTEAAGGGGSIALVAGSIAMERGSRVTVEALRSGDAGNIRVTTGDLSMKDSAILSRAENSAGGDIGIGAHGQVNLLDSGIRTSTRGSSAADAGGNIRISRPHQLALNRSTLNANAVAGRGGNITLAVEGLAVSTDSAITATSERNVDGLVSVDPVETLTNNLSQPPAPEPVAASPLRGECAVARGLERSSLVVHRVPRTVEYAVSAGCR